MVLDGEPPQQVSTGQTLTLDGKAHILIFDCPVCKSVEKDVPAGTENMPLSVRIPIKDATLEIVGDPTKTYQIVGRADVPVRAGTNFIKMSGDHDSVTVRQIETNATVSTTVYAGRSATAAF
jgi:hypothetical protein